MCSRARTFLHGVEEEAGGCGEGGGRGRKTKMNTLYGR